MDPAKSNGQRRRLLVAHGNPHVRNLLVELSNLLREYEIVIASNIEEMEAHCNVQAVQWLLVEEDLPGQEISLHSGLGSRALAKTRVWLEGGADRRAIVLTSKPCWDKGPLKLSSQLQVILGSRLTLDDLPAVADMVRAGDCGWTFAWPTVVRLRWRGSGPSNAKEYTLSYGDVCDGPLHARLIEALQARPDSIKSTLPVIVAEGGECPKKAAWLRYCHELWDLLAGSDESPLKAVLTAAAQTKGAVVEDEPGRECPIYPIHLHIECDEASLAVPIDHALPPGEADNHVFQQLPVVWRLSGRGRKPESTEQERWNPTHEDRFQAIYSCEESFHVDGISVDGIDAVVDHARRVHEVSGQTMPARHVRNLAEIAGALAGSQSDKGRSAYLITHGGRPADPDSDCVVIGPCPDGVADHFITACRLGTSSELRGTRFFFFNSCSLGRQANPEKSRGSYVGGFAEGVIRYEVCDETLCHRWPVSQEWAKKLAERFYQMRPLTAHGRAAALLIARSEIKGLIASKGGAAQHDMTWLAPIHLWTST